jgi:DNA-binding transcriptional MerR regulator
MKVSELSRVTGVSVPTIKYYLREGLLPGGAPTGPNQARYDESHVRRLALIRALREIGGLSIATIGEVLHMADGSNADTVAAMGRAMDAIAKDADRGAETEAEVDMFATKVRAMLAAEGWRFREDAGSLRMLAQAVVRGTRAMGQEPVVEALVRYARPMMVIAEGEFSDENSVPLESGEEAIAWAVLGTVLMEPVILALRRLAHEHLALAALPENVRQAMIRDGIRPTGSNSEAGTQD